MNCPGHKPMRRKRRSYLVLLRFDRLAVLLQLAAIQKQTHGGDDAGFTEIHRVDVIHRARTDRGGVVARVSSARVRNVLVKTHVVNRMCCKQLLASWHRLLVCLHEETVGQ